jgi:hypothetical protein
VNTGQAVFAQIMARIPHWEFHRAYHACEVAAPRADALSPWGITFSRFASRR